MNQKAVSDKELFSYLIHDLRALSSALHSKLSDVNEKIRIINKQPYLHKQINCLERYKTSRKDIDKLLSKTFVLTENTLLLKNSLTSEQITAQSQEYKLLKKEYFELK